VKGTWGYISEALQQKNNSCDAGEIFSSKTQAIREL